ncbi:unnamed protein product, partial [Iphiclides podalirius]
MELALLFLCIPGRVSNELEEMQQPVYQEQQSNQQGAGQQMLLCPVRLVYETQILVQPGEQIQPNQTIFINPQNTPPWIQNRPQNQVIYVQQMAPNNFMPHVQQQHTGQNPLYIQQNYNNLHQIMSQQVLSQAQHEVRSANVQMANMLQRGTVQVSQASSTPNNPNVTSTPAVGPPANYGMLPPYYTNIQGQINQGQINFIPANVTGKQMVANVQTSQKTVATSAVNLGRNVEIQQNVYRPMLQQTYQQENNMPATPLPQSITMVPMQSQTAVQQKTNVNATPMDQNMAQIRPLQPQIINAPVLPQSTLNTSMTNDKMMRKVATVTPKGNTAISNLLNTTNKSSLTYSYRPIQPRPQQQRHFAPNILPASTHSQIILPIQATNVSSGGNTQTYPMPGALPTNYIKTEQSVFNRKRKSESPDEMQKKMAPNIVTQKNVTTTPMPITTNTYTDVGVNTIPLQRINNKPINTIPNDQTITINRTTESKQLIKDNLTQRIENQTDKDPKQTSETEKLLRNTVYTQARNRVLADKQETVTTNSTKIESKTADVKLQALPEKDTNKDLIENFDNKEIIKKEENNALNVGETKKEVSKATREEATLKEINLLGNGKTNENGFVLTHVLDGYVIQESNIAFPIRKPLQERTLQPNTEDLEVKKEENKNNQTNTDQNGSKICNLSFLNLNEEKLPEEEKTVSKNIEDDKEDNKDSPFTELKPQTVKTWTVQQLTTHLQKYNWDETVSVLREHEIDGESLFLVSKGQLTTIGVNEDHANIICQFVKS